MNTYIMHTQAQGYDIVTRLWAWAKPQLASGKKLTLKVCGETRNLEQNALLHATITDIAKRRDWAGRKWDAETWKRLLVGAWSRAKGDQVMMVPALDGLGVEIVFRRTSKMSKSECAELIDWIQAWDATQ